MSTAAQTSHRKLWEERNVYVAFILAVLVPGLGHLYQGRVLKGLIYMVGILGLFMWGVKLGEGVVVYNLTEPRSQIPFTFHYAAQFGAGAISYPVFIQKKRVASETNRTARQLEQPLTAPFTGRLKSIDNETESGVLEGMISLRPEKNEFDTETVGEFKGRLDGKPISLELRGNFFPDRPIGAGFRRAVACGIVGNDGELPGNAKLLEGSIPRSVIDGFGVPPDPRQLQEVTGRLGKLHELACVFTWIAGLLNIQAIWDCVQGPAYGFGDEQWTETPNPDENSPDKPADPALNKSASPA